MKIWIDGQLKDQSEATVNVFDHGVLYGDGVFEGIRAYGGKIFQFKAHLDRLFASARRIRLWIPFTEQQLYDATYDAMQANGVTEGYIRMVVTRGAGSLGISPAQCVEPCTYIIADSISMYSEEQYRSGMDVIIAQTIRTNARSLDPRVKSLNYLNNILAKLECIDAGAGEAIMLNDDGEVSEASGDNVFIVEGGRVATPPAEAGILMGVTRAAVLFLSKRLGMEVAEEPITPERLLTADECFLTGTGAEIIAAIRVDGKPVGSGTVGPVTQQLLAEYRQFIHTDEVIPYLA